MTLGQLIAAQNPRPALKGRTHRLIDPMDFEDAPEYAPMPVRVTREPVGKQSGRLLVRGLSAAMLELHSHECVGVEVQPTQDFRYVEKWAHTYAGRHGMKVSVRHEYGIVWIREREGL